MTLIGCVAQNKGLVRAADIHNKDIITNIITYGIDYGGLDVLINASEEYIGGDNYEELNAQSTVWYTLGKIYAFRLPIIKENANAVFETGIDLLSHLKSVTAVDRSSALIGNIFCAFKTMVETNYATMMFQTNNYISKCLDVFKKNDGTWKDNKNFETPAQHAITFLDRCHFRQRLFNGDSDYTLILSFCAFVLKNFGTNKIIRVIGTKFVNNSFSFVQDKNIIKRSGCMEALAFLLASNKIGEDEKRIVGALIGRIATLP